MKNSDLRILLSKTFEKLNAYHGFDTGSFGELDYKINYQIDLVSFIYAERKYTVDIDVWCKSTTRVDFIADEIEKLLNHKNINIGSGDATFYLESRIECDEKSVYRRTLNYSVSTY